MSDNNHDDPFRPLRERLGPPPTALSSAYSGLSPGDARRQYDAERKRRMALLMLSCGISPNDKDCWEKLAWRLAEEHVEGLKPWTYEEDAERQFLITSQVYYLVELKGLSVNAAAKAIASTFPNEGSADAIRSAYRDSNRNGVRSAFLSLWTRITEGAGKENLTAIFEEAFGEPIKVLKNIDKPRRGRPGKN